MDRRTAVLLACAVWMLSCGRTRVSEPRAAKPAGFCETRERPERASAGTGPAEAIVTTAVPVPPAAPGASVAPPEPDEPTVIVPEDMVIVPPGSFVMGADAEGELDERPAHEVTLRAFLYDKTEVTNEAYAVCVEANVCRKSASLVGSPLVHGMPRTFQRPDHPVVGVSWEDASTYCRYRDKRLPREAEWERAARGDDARRYVWGNDEPDPKKHGAFGGRATTEPVGVFPEGASAFGQLDLAGNVWEWMADDYDPFAYTRPGASEGRPGSCDEIKAAQNQLRREGKQGFTGTNPIPTECEKVLRGGAYNYRASGLRNSNRVHHPAHFRIAVAGFRCARDMPMATP